MKNKFMKAMVVLLIISMIVPLLVGIVQVGIASQPKCVVYEMESTVTDEQVESVINKYHPEYLITCGEYMIYDSSIVYAEDGIVTLDDTSLSDEDKSSIIKLLEEIKQ